MSDVGTNHGCARPPRFPWPLVAAAVVLAVGCSDGGRERFPVHGRVTFNGKPVAEAMVVFHRQAGVSDDRQKPIAVTDPNGTFALTTDRPGDGAAPGKYAITVELRAERMVGEELVREGRNLLPARYARPESSGLTCHVEGQVDALAIDLVQGK